MKQPLFLILTALTASLATAQPADTEANKPASAPATTNETAATAPASVSAAPAVSTNANEAIISAENTTNGLRMNFRGAPLNMVLDYLSDAAGFIINKTTDVRGTVEVWSKQPVTKDEAVELLSSVLKKNGYAVTRNGRILTILALDTAKTSSELPVVTGVEPDEVETSDEIETRIIPVHYANAAQLVPNLQVLLPTSANLMANESANTLILVATKSDIKRMLKIVQALDTSIATVSSIKVIPLQYSDAKDTAAMITQLFSQNSNQGPQGNFGGPNFGGPGGPGGGGPGGFFRAAMQAAASANNRGGNAAATHVVAVADERSNSVVISATPALVSTIEDMLKELDRQVADETELRVFRLTNADPSELADQLAKLFPDETSSANNNNNNQFVPFFRRGGFGPGNNNNTASNASDRAKKMGKVLAVPDPRTACLIVTASKALMPQIAEMIAELDSNKGKKEIVGYFELQNADPQDVSQNLQDLFNRSTVRMQNNNNRNSLLGQNNPLTLRETTGNQQSTIGNVVGRSGSTGNGALGGGAGALR